MKLSEEKKKAGWQIVRFDEIARNISERVEPSETELEVYVGLEHLDPQSLRIMRRGVPADVKGQKLRVRPGQIIFGKRRAYQKKLAVADFDGICSAHAMVLEEIPGKIIPDLLPFLMQSDLFMDRAVAISEGSLSPTIKWKTLAMQEFPLPPLERQKAILEVLEKVEECSRKIDDCFEASIATLRRLVDYVCTSDRQKTPFLGSKRFRLKELCNANQHSLGVKTAGEYQFTYVDISSCSFPGCVEAPEFLRYKDAPSRAKRIVHDGDTLVSTVRPNYQATCYFETAVDIVASTGFSVLTPKDAKLSRWIYYSTLTKQFVHSLTNLMVGTSFPAVSDEDILVQFVDVPSGQTFESWSTAINNTLMLYHSINTRRNSYVTFRRNLLAKYMF